MPFQQMIAEMNALMEAMQLALNILGVAVFAVFAVYLAGFAIFALDKMINRPRPMLPSKPAINFNNFANGKQFARFIGYQKIR